MLRIYRAPDGRTYQYEEGTQPDGFVLDEPTEQPKAEPKKAAPKRRATSNKRRTAQNKAKGE